MALMRLTPRGRLFVAIGVLLVTHVALWFVRPSGASQDQGEAAVSAGIVFDVGGRGDKSFNDGAYNGGLKAERELGADVRLIEPGEGSDREAGLRLLAAEGLDLVLGVGFIFTDDLRQLATEYTSTNFAGVDYALQNDSLGNDSATAQSCRAQIP
jgi:basic membrane protein A